MKHLDALVHTITIISFKMVANISNSEGNVEMLLNILSNAYSKKDDLLKDTIGMSDWRASILNASSKNIKHVLEGFKSVNKVLQRHLKDNETLTGNPSSITESEGFSLSTFLLLIDGYAILTLALVGMVINIFGVYILSSDERRGKIYSLFLSTLFTFDASFLLFEFLKSMERHFISVSSSHIKTYNMVVNAGLRFSMISSVFMLIAIARVRLSAIKKPFQHNSDIVSWKERRNYWLRCLIPIISTSLVLTLPVYFEVDVFAHEEKNIERIQNQSSLRLNPLYSTVYAGFLNFGLSWLMPITYLVYLAYQIKFELKWRNVRLRSYRAHQMDSVIEQENKTSNTLVTIIITLIALHAFRIFWIFSEIYILLSSNVII